MDFSNFNYNTAFLFILGLILLIIYFVSIILKCSNNSINQSNNVFFTKKYDKKSIKGMMGERRVNYYLNYLPFDKYKVLNDIMIMVNGKTYQIDHVVISIYGIFVIETKNFSVIVEGKVKDDKWLQRYGRKKYYCMNPLKQNYLHIKAIYKLLGVSENKIHNVICMSGNASFKLDNYDYIVYADDILKYISKYKKVELTNIDELYNKLIQNNIVDNYIRNEHSRNVNATKNNKDLSKCPLCGNGLVMRNGKYGIFIGCINYPKCKYTRKINKNDY